MEHNQGLRLNTSSASNLDSRDSSVNASHISIGLPEQCENGGIQNAAVGINFCDYSNPEGVPIPVASDNNNVQSLLAGQFLEEPEVSVEIVPDTRLMNASHSIKSDDSGNTSEINLKHYVYTETIPRLPKRVKQRVVKNQSDDSDSDHFGKRRGSFHSGDIKKRNKFCKMAESKNGDKYDNKEILANFQELVHLQHKQCERIEKQGQSIEVLEHQVKTVLMSIDPSIHKTIHPLVDPKDQDEDYDIDTDMCDKKSYYTKVINDLSPNLNPKESSLVKLDEMEKEHENLKVEIPEVETAEALSSPCYGESSVRDMQKKLNQLRKENDEKSKKLAQLEQQPPQVHCHTYIGGSNPTINYHFSGGESAQPNISRPQQNQNSPHKENID